MQAPAASGQVDQDPGPVLAVGWPIHQVGGHQLVDGLGQVGRQHGVGGLAHAMAGALRQPRWRLGCPGLARPGRTALLADIVPASFY